MEIGRAGDDTGRGHFYGLGNDQEALVSESPERTLDRVGSVAGGVAVVLLIALIQLFPSVPAADEPIATIANATASRSQTLLIEAYVGALATGALLVFGAAVAARLRRAGSAWWIVAIAGMTAAVPLSLVGWLMSIVFVRAVGHGVTGDPLWTVYGGDLAGFLQAIPYAVFMFGAGMGIRATGALPRWTGLVALVSAALFVVGAASVAGTEVDGAPFIFPLILAYLAITVWTVVVSIALWRRAGQNLCLAGTPTPAEAV